MHIQICIMQVFFGATKYVKYKYSINGFADTDNVHRHTCDFSELYHRESPSYQSIIEVMYGKNVGWWSRYLKDLCVLHFIHTSRPAN